MLQALITVPMLIAFLGSIHFATILHTNWNNIAPKWGSVRQCISPHSDHQVRLIEAWGNSLEQSTQPSERSENPKLWAPGRDLGDQPFDCSLDGVLSIFGHCRGKIVGWQSKNV